MTITFNNKVPTPHPPEGEKVGYKTNRDRLEVRAKASKSTLIESRKAQLWLQKVSKYWDTQQEIDAELRASLEEKHIPQTIEEGLKRGRISAQEIIEVVEEMTKTTLGPRERSYIVANVLSQDHFNMKAASANNYCPEVADYIIERMLAGETIRNICRDKSMPHLSKFLYWVQQNPTLRERYSLAKDLLAEVWAHEILPLSDKVRMGVTTTVKADGSIEYTTSDMVARTRMQVEARKFLLSKALPKEYGNVDGNIGTQPKVIIEGGLPIEPLGESVPDIPDVTNALPDEPLGEEPQIDNGGDQ